MITRLEALISSSKFPCILGGTVGGSQTHAGHTWGHRLQQIHVQELSECQKYSKFPRTAFIVSDVCD